MNIQFEYDLAGKNRPSRDAQYLMIADIIGLRGTCLRGKLGCVITQNNRIVSTGYNGSLHGNNYCETTCDTRQPCIDSVHAEANAIAAAARNGIKLEGGTLYCSQTPCYNCAKLIIQAGIKRVVYHTAYRDDSGLALLIEKGIKVELLKEELKFRYE